MAVKLRLMRMGKKKQPTYRIVASDSRSPRDGRFIEIVGTYAPRSDPSVIEVDNARAVRWLAQGAQPTDTVRKLLGISGAWGEFEAHRASGAPVPPRAPRQRVAAPAVATRPPAAKPAPAAKPEPAAKAEPESKPEPAAEAEPAADETVAAEPAAAETAEAEVENAEAETAEAENAEAETAEAETASDGTEGSDEPGAGDPAAED